MSTDCHVCNVICTITTGDSHDDQCHNMLDEFAQNDDIGTEDLCDAFEEEFDMSCDDLPFSIPDV